MSISEHGVYPIVLLCKDSQAQCRCSKPENHVELGDDLHECHKNRCMGAWKRGAHGEFIMIRLPFLVEQEEPGGVL